MSDQPPTPRRSPYPRMPKKMTQSTESKFVGYVVLGFGILAVLAVLLLAFIDRGPNLDVAQPDAQRVQEIAGGRQQTQDLIKPPAPIKPKSEKTLFFKRQPDFKAADMKGNWQTMVGRYTAILQMNEGVYQVILASDNPDAPRYYSSGEYTVLEDMITLNPRNDWPKPTSSSPGTAYDTITVAPFSLIGAFQDGKMLWQNVPRGEARVFRTLTSPLFMGEKVDYVVWQKIN